LGQGDAFASKNLCRRFQQAQNALRGNAERCNRFRKSLTMLQARLDQQAEEFCTEAAALKHTGDAAALSRQAGLFMQNQLEQLEAELQRLAFVSRTHSETVAVGR
jgi:chromosome segregation ATPase